MLLDLLPRLPRPARLGDVGRDSERLPAERLDLALGSVEAVAVACEQPDVCAALARKRARSRAQPRRRLR